MIIKCPHCYTWVIPADDGECPACRKNVNELSGTDPKRTLMGKETVAMTECCGKDGRGHSPGQEEAIHHRKPERILVYGNGFLPSESAAASIIESWLHDNKHLFGNAATDDVPTKIMELPWIPHNNFNKTIRTIRQQHRGQVIDAKNLIFYHGPPINNTCPAMLLVAVWPAAKSQEIGSLIALEANNGRRVDYNRRDRRWWQFWK